MRIKAGSKDDKLIKNNAAPVKRKIAVIGHNAEHNHADGGGSAEIKAIYEISPLLGLKKGSWRQCRYTICCWILCPGRQRC